MSDRDLICKTAAKKSRLAAGRTPDSIFCDIPGLQYAAAALVEPPVLTPMSLSVAEEWPISSAPWLRVRRVGWLDQKGRVWTEIPPSSEFDGGSLTPLLIQLEDKFEPPVLSRAVIDELIDRQGYTTNGSMTFLR